MGSGNLGRLVGIAVVLFAVWGSSNTATAATTSDSSGKSGGSQSRIDARCAGDIVYGDLRTSAPAGTTYVLALFQQRTRFSTWLFTGKSVVIVTRTRQSSYPFSFDIASFNAFAYAIRGAAKGDVVSSASCAPGHQVPEAPNALLLAGAVAGVFGVSLARRRRRSAL